MTTKQAPLTTQVYRIYIKATPEQVWEAIIEPDWTDRYGYGGRTEFDLSPGAAFKTRPSQAMKDGAAKQGFQIPDVIIDGEVVEADRPRRLVLMWRMLMDPEVAAEGFTRLSYEIESAGGATRLTVTHELKGAPKLAALVSGSREAEGAGGGWSWVLSDLKSLLETGAVLAE